METHSSLLILVSTLIFPLSTMLAPSLYYTVIITLTLLIDFFHEGMFDSVKEFFSAQ